MKIDKKNFIKNYISNIEVTVMDVGFGTVDEKWMDFDYIPDYNKFYFIISGEGLLKIDGKEYYPETKELYILPKGVLQSYSVISDIPFTKYWCHFTADVSGINIFDIIKTPYKIDIKDIDAFKNTFDELLKYYTSDIVSSSILVKSYMMKLIALLFENLDIKDITLAISKTSEKILEIVDYIDNNYDKEISIEILADKVNFHPNYFIKIFKKTLGTSPIQYVNNLRIQKAKNLLVTTDMQLYEICSLVGINDISYFSRLFKQYTGSSPTRYKSLTMNNPK